MSAERPFELNRSWEAARAAVETPDQDGFVAHVDYVDRTPENNLSIATMDFADFPERADEDRSFAASQVRTGAACSLA